MNNVYKFDIEPLETDLEFEDTLESFDEFAEEAQDIFPEYGEEESWSVDPESAHLEWEAEVMRNRRIPHRPGMHRPRSRVIRRPGLVIPDPSICTCPAPDCPQHGSEYVQWVQSALNQIMNLRLSVTGIMAAATRSALRSFQEKQGLPVTGIVGPDTERALIAASGGQIGGAGATKPDEPGMTGPPEPAARPSEPGMTKPAEPAPTSSAAEFDFEWEVAPLRENQRLTYPGQVVRFPSGEILRVVTGLPIDKHEDYWDPTGSANPLLDTGPVHKDKKLSTSFTVRELTTSGGVSADIARIDPKLVECLQRLRDHVGKGVTITSGFRSWKRNRDIYEKRGKTPTLSQHCAGRGADIQIAGMNGLEIGKAAIDACGPNIGVGLGNTFAHIDVRGFAAAWNYGGVKDLWVAEIKRYQKEKGDTSRKPSTVAAKASFRYVKDFSGPASECTEALKRAGKTKAEALGIINAQIGAAIAMLRKAATDLKRGSRSSGIKTVFLKIFRVRPEFVPTWLKQTATIKDRGDVVATRCKRVADLLASGRLKFFCTINSTNCPDCSNDSSDFACSSWGDESTAPKNSRVVCLGDAFWDDMKAGNTDSLLATLMHEPFHIYFGIYVTEHRSDAGKFGGINCIVQFVFETNGRTAPDRVNERCRDMPVRKEIDELEQPGRRKGSRPPPKPSLSTPGHWLTPFTSSAIPKYKDAAGNRQSSACSVYVPHAAWKAKTIDLLVFFHGDAGPCSDMFNPDPKNNNKKFGLDVQIHDSGRKVALAVPVVHWIAGKSSNVLGTWTAANLNKFVEEVLVEIGRQTGVRPTLGRLIIAGHSHAYAILTPLACEFDQGAPATKMGALARLGEVWALDSTYAPWHVHALEVWTRKCPSGRFIAVLYKKGTPLSHWKSYYNTKGYCSSGFKPPNLRICTVDEGHCAIPTKYIGKLLSTTRSSPDWCRP